MGEIGVGVRVVDERLFSHSLQDDSNDRALNGAPQCHSTHRELAVTAPQQLVSI